MCVCLFGWMKMYDYTCALIGIFHHLNHTISMAGLPHHLHSPFSQCPLHPHGLRRASTHLAGLAIYFVPCFSGSRADGQRSAAGTEQASIGTCVLGPCCCSLGESSGVMVIMIGKKNYLYYDGKEYL